VKKDDVKPNDLQATIKSAEPASGAAAGKRMDLVVRLSNKSKRALHYISDVRAIRYDPLAKRLTIALSDEGREILSLNVEKVPVIRYIDPQSDAEIRISVPENIIKLPRQTPGGKLAFEKYDMAEMREVVVELGWADVPLYKDTRPRTAEAARKRPAALWEQHKARTTFRVPKGGAQDTK
jgi:hypothetical protein